jgi:DNA-binding CsgD family transcriptional regulator
MQTLTPNELKLLKLVCRDKDNSEIAAELEYSLRYTEKIKTALYIKTKTKSNLGLFKWAVKNGHHAFKG